MGAHEAEIGIVTLPVEHPHPASEPLAARRLLHCLGIFKKSEFRTLGLIYPIKGIYYSFAARVFVEMLKKHVVARSVL
ncbi:MAG: hypothetical protein JRI95_12145 [Deltaproteobacteria bacterium]|nr:hypothetical protein [Deltaproteobacteria bacterium]MBW2085534.1 hypothetical protein [Deltaproteobacteria bacterium]